MNIFISHFSKEIFSFKCVIILMFLLISSSSSDEIESFLLLLLLLLLFSSKLNFELLLKTKNKT